MITATHRLIRHFGYFSKHALSDHITATDCYFSRRIPALPIYPPNVVHHRTLGSASQVTTQTFSSRLAVELKWNAGCHHSLKLGADAVEEWVSVTDIAEASRLQRRTTRRCYLLKSQDNLLLAGFIAELAQ